MVKTATARSDCDLSQEQERRAQTLKRSSLMIDGVGSSIVRPEPPLKDGWLRLFKDVWAA